MMLIQLALQSFFGGGGGGGGGGDGVGKGVLLRGSL